MSSGWGVFLRVGVTITVLRNLAQTARVQIRGEETFRGFTDPGGSAIDSDEIIRLQEKLVKDAGSRSPLLRLLARRRARRLERTRQIRDQRLAWRVQDIIVGCGLSQAHYSIGGGRSVRIPQVTSVVAGPPVGLNIHMLPGQVPEDFVRHARAIAYHLGVAEVRVIPLQPNRIRLELLPKSG